MWNSHTECQCTHRGVMDNKADISEKDSTLFEKKISISVLKGISYHFSKICFYFFSKFECIGA